MSLLFVSHSSIDKQAAIELRDRLLHYGYSPDQIFLDSDRESGIRAGGDWERALYDGLKRHRALIVLCSKNWEKSKWCFAELIYAKSQGKHVFPVMLEEMGVSGPISESQAVFPLREGESAYERLFESLENNHLGPTDDLGWPPQNGDDCPYPGLMAFDESYAAVYFGRVTECEQVLQRLNQMRTNGEPRLLMIVGGSGSGKSSLLKAGVIPRLKHKTRVSDWLVLPILRYADTSEDLNLFGILGKSIANMFPADNRPDWKKLRAGFEVQSLDESALKAAASSFFDASQDLLMARDCPDATIVVSIDQFEELISAGPSVDARHFLYFLKTLLSRKNHRLIFIGTMRSDYLDAYEHASGSLEQPYFDTFRLPPFPSDRIREIIEKPAAIAEVAFEPELVEHLCDECRPSDKKTADALPLLAFTLRRLFDKCADDKKITKAEYDDLGGMTGAIKQSVSAILPSTLPPEVERDLRVTFVRLLAQANDRGEVVRRTASWASVPDTVKPLIEKFIKQRLLHKSGQGDEEQIEISHESLFRCWDKLEH